MTTWASLTRPLSSYALLYNSTAAHQPSLLCFEEGSRTSKLDAHSELATSQPAVVLQMPRDVRTVAEDWS